ncbi:MAG TPA: TetR/AcrR family transcriptional regulator [Solirubrobacteraceae bacterium]|nr:TetR/AcrR family transcriptional regulator [Solirubrobacteraceae bacterium]
MTPAQTRARLVQSAAALIDEGGYAAATVVAVAERAGVATGALYRHFPSKAELFVEVFRSAAEEELEAMRAAAAQPADFAERLETVISTYATSALRHRRLAWALVHEPVDPLVDAERLTYRRLYRDGMTALLRQGIESGDIPEQHAELTSAAVVGAIAEALVGPLSPLAGGPAPEEEIVAGIVAFCRRAVGVETDVPAR